MNRRSTCKHAALALITLLLVDGVGCSDSIDKTSIDQTSINQPHGPQLTDSRVAQDETPSDAVDDARYAIARLDQPAHAGASTTYEALNPANGLHTDFVDGRVLLRPLAPDASDEDAPRWTVELSFDGVGRAGMRQTPPVVEAIVAEAPRAETAVVGGASVELFSATERVEFRRGEITEWYKNDPRGLEQGFDVHTRPEGAGELVIAVGFSGDLEPRLVSETSAVLGTEDGRTELRYSGLVAWDARGTLLDAHMQLGPDNTIELVVDDRQAVYPVTVDPWFETRKLLASDGAAEDHFGHAVAISGDTAIVGAWGDNNNGTNSGSAYIFARNEGGTNNWGEVTKLLASDRAADDEFGDVVAISGDVAIVGASEHDDNGSNSGAAYIFARNEGGTDNWGEVTKLTAGNFQDRFGGAAAVSGDVAIVGSHGDSDNGSASGSAYIFARNRGGTDNWGEVTKLLASDAAAYDSFGEEVTISGDIAIVGADGNDDNGSSSGAAYIFARNEGGTDNWGEVTKLVASDAAAYDYFGGEVAVSGDVAIVGAGGDDDNGAASGSAYIFARNEGGTDNWGEVTKLVASDGASDDWFGRVAISGDTTVVGADGHNDNGSKSGAAYIFARNEGGTDNWGEVTKLVASDGAANDRFGYVVAISGDTTVVGAYGDTDNGSSSGSAYTFTDVTTAAEDDTGSTDEDTPTTIDVLANDSAPTGQSLSVAGTSQPSNGGVTHAGGVVTYTPDVDFHGSDSFTYQASDGTYTVSATVTVTVKPINDAPVATDDTATVDEDNSVTVDVLANDTDVEGDALTISSTSQPANGSVTTSGDQLSYTPEADFFGTDSLTYQVTDGSDTDSATVTITVAPVNDAPVAADDSATVSAGSVATIDVLANDVDIDGDALTVTLQSSPSSGTASANADGTISYAAPADYLGTEILSYQIADPDGETASASLTITVSATNEPPSFVAPTPADGATLTATAGDAFSFELAAEDAEGDTLSFSVTPLPDGAEFDAATRKFTWTPGADDPGEHPMTLEVRDAESSDSRQISVRVEQAQPTGNNNCHDQGDAGQDDACDDGPGGADAGDSTGSGSASDDGCGCTSSGGSTNLASVLIALLGLIGLRLRNSFS